VYKADDAALVVDCHNSGTDGDDVSDLVHVIDIEDLIARLDRERMA
jgi:hypothetical protein